MTETKFSLELTHTYKQKITQHVFRTVASIGPSDCAVPKFTDGILVLVDRKNVHLQELMNLESSFLHFNQCCGAVLAFTVAPSLSLG